MRLAAFLLVNGLILGAWWLLLGRAGARAVSERLVYAGLLAACQIVGTEIVLAAIGALRLTWVLGALLAVSATITVVALTLRPAPADGQLPAPDRSALRGRLADVTGGFNLLLLAAALFVCLWITVATWLLPPRGIDDLVYHLPPVFHFIQMGGFSYMPLELRLQFFMPLGGDLLFLWPALFLHSATWVDGVQLVVAVYGVAALYALCRAFGIGRRESAFAGLLFLFTPVVLAQSGSNYTDLVVAVCHVVLVYAVVQFWQRGRAADLLLAGLAGGLGLSAKYSMLIAIALAQPVVLLRLWRDGGPLVALVRYAGFACAALALPGYWLWRNWRVLGYPLYPYDLTATGLRSLGGVPQPFRLEGEPAAAGPALAKLFEEPGRLLLFLLRDPGLGSLNGGFGFVFWGLGLPALVWCCLRALRAVAARDLFPLLFWSQALAMALIFLQQTDAVRLAYNMRLAMVLVPFALLAFGLALRHLHPLLPGAALALRGLAVAGALLATVHLANSKLPTFDISAAVADRARQSETSPQRYLREGTGDLPALSAVFEPLDYLSEASDGWLVYMAADWNVFFTAPLFGSRLQNKVWNFVPAKGRSQPDALVFHPGFSAKTPMFYLRGRITAAEIRRDPRYELVASGPPAELWVARSRLGEPRVRQRLVRFYERRFGEDVARLRQLLGRLPAADAIVTSSTLGHAFRYLALTGELPMAAHLVSPGDVAGKTDQLRAGGAQVVITLDGPLPGARFRRVAEIPAAGSSVPLYVNEVGS